MKNIKKLQKNLIVFFFDHKRFFKIFSKITFLGRLFTFPNNYWYDALALTIKFKGGGGGGGGGGCDDAS